MAEEEENSKREVAEKGKGWMDGVVERSKAGMERMRKKENSTEGQQKKKEAPFFLFSLTLIRKRRKDGRSQMKERRSRSD